MLRSCKEICEGATDYLEGPTTFWHRLDYAMHLMICKLCRRFMAQLALTGDVAARLGAQDAPDESRIDAIVERLASEGYVNRSSRED